MAQDSGSHREHTPDPPLCAPGTGAGSVRRGHTSQPVAGAPGPTGLRVARTSLEIASVDMSEVLRYLGYHGQELTETLRSRIDEMVGRCIALARPRAALSCFAVRTTATHAMPSPHQEGVPVVELEGCTLRLQGQSIHEHLAGASEVVLMAVTLGIEVDRELRRLSLTDALAQVVFDSAATALVERAADAAEAQVRAYAAARGGYPSWRFSPGYGDLPLACQRDFLAALDASRQLGITLTPSNLMIPTKSITAIVGVHPTPQPGMGDSCTHCNLSEFCTIRAAGRSCRA